MMATSQTSLGMNKFLQLLKVYVRLNVRLVSIYVIALFLDSIIKMFSIISIIPLIDFLSSDNSSSNELQEVTLFYIDILSFFNIEFTLGSSISLFIVATLLALFSEICFYFIGRKNSYRISYHLTSNGFKNFFERGLKFINKQKFGVLQNTFQREIDQITGGMDGVLILISSIVQSFFILYLAFSLSVVMTSVTLIIMVLIILLISGLNRLVLIWSSKTLLSSNNLSQALFEPLMNAKQVLSFGRFNHAYINHSKKYNDHVSDALRSQTLIYSVPLIFRMLGIVASLVALYYAVSVGESTVALVAALVALIRLTPIASQITGSFATISSAIPSVQQFINLFGNVSTEKDETRLVKFNGFSNSIELLNVSYSHSELRGAISNINLSIPKNSYTVFVGPSGSGKTTCVDVILGLLRPNSGDVKIDDEFLKEIDLNSFLGCIGYVQQTPFLFSGTIRDNLLWSYSSASEKDLWDALDLAGISDFVSSLKLKLDTNVGDKGVMLSGGQKQRIVLAQALIRKPEILILDEATNSLDHKSEVSIIKTLNKISHNVTIISITHNLSIAKDADQVFVFDNGVVSESGSYNELVNNKKSFLCKIKKEKV